MRRVLIVSPYFSPVNAADMQRTRLVLPYLRDVGWEPEVLACEPRTIEAPVLDPLLEKTYPADIPVHRVAGLPPRLTRALGFGGFWLRARGALAREGARLLAAKKFDLVFFSTTQFDAFALGPRWLARFGVPYVLDYQDPWVTDHYARTRQRPPGGPLRFAWAQRRARRAEPRVLAGAAGLVSVSPAYLDDLASRAPAVRRLPSIVLSFGASPRDLATARDHPPPRPLVPFGDGRIHLVYTGRGGEDVHPVLRRLFGALADFRSRSPAAASRLRLHFIGTSYAPASLARETILPVARELGVGDLVHEHCARVPYFEALHYLARADAVLALGSEDPAYNASKLAPCLLAARPLLALFHRASPAHALLGHDGSEGVTRIAFDPAAATSDISRSALREWFVKAGDGGLAPASGRLPDALSAEHLTRRLGSFFDRCLDTPPPPPPHDRA